MMKTERISFTLIELLIVIAIIAILAGMLLPALGKARAKGKQTLCTSNMKQLSTTVNMYCDDWKEYFPAYISADFFRQVEPYTRRKWVPGGSGIRQNQNHTFQLRMQCLYQQQHCKRI